LLDLQPSTGSSIFCWQTFNLPLEVRFSVVRPPTFHWKFDFL
jgi:hypothetical protein